MMKLYLVVYCKKKKKKKKKKKQERKRREKNTMLTLNILIPYHTCPKHLTRSFNYLFYLSPKLPNEKHLVTTLITPRSALGPSCLLRLLVNTVSAKYFHFFFFFFLYLGMEKKKQ